MRTHILRLAAASILLALGLLWGGARSGQAQSASGPQTHQHLLGKSVGVFLAHYPTSAGFQIAQLAGTVQAVNDHGMWLQATHRGYVSKKKAEEYPALTYITWSSVAYVRTRD